MMKLTIQRLNYSKPRKTFVLSLRAKIAIKTMITMKKKFKKKFKLKMLLMNLMLFAKMK